VDVFGTVHIHCEAEKRNQLIFVCSFVKMQRILMHFSLLYLEMNSTREVWTSPTSPN